MYLIHHKWKAWKRAGAKKAKEKYEAEYDNAYNTAESIYKSRGMNGLVIYMVEAGGHEHKGAVAYYVKIKKFHLKMGVIKHERS